MRCSPTRKRRGPMPVNTSTRSASRSGKCERFSSSRETAEDRSCPDASRQSRALVGAGAGLLFGITVLFAANVDWVFLYLLSAPLRLADAAHDLAGVSASLLYPLTCAYFVGLGWIFGLLWVFLDFACLGLRCRDRGACWAPYDEHPCTAASWLYPFQGVAQLCSPCNGCNGRVVVCILKCLSHPNSVPNIDHQCYDALSHRYFGGVCKQGAPWGP
jgi:hypothetical protein